MDEYLAMIKIFAGNFAPKGYAFCQGQIMAISTNTALYSLLGTVYGGDGRTTFALPNLSGRAPIGTGTGPGLTPVQLGHTGGSESVVISTAQMPTHTHQPQITVQQSISETADSDSPEGAYPASTGVANFGTQPSPGQFAGALQVQATIAPTGNSQPLPLRNPYLGINYVICINGLFPSRN